MLLIKVERGGQGQQRDCSAGSSCMAWHSMAQLSMARHSKSQPGMAQTRMVRPSIAQLGPVCVQISQSPAVAGGPCCQPMPGGLIPRALAATEFLTSAAHLPWSCCSLPASVGLSWGHRDICVWGSVIAGTAEGRAQNPSSTACSPHSHISHSTVLCARAAAALRTTPQRCKTGRDEGSCWGRGSGGHAGPRAYCWASTGLADGPKPYDVPDGSGKDRTNAVQRGSPGCASLPRISHGSSQG